MSVTFRVPVRVPAAEGLKVTLIVQLEPAARLELQLVLEEKSPLAVMLEMLRVPLPVFLRVTLCALEVEPTGSAEKLREVDDRLTAGEPLEAAAVPVRLTDWVVGLALSVIVRVPVRVPVAVGLKVTLKVQLEDADKLGPQVLVSEKSPLIATLEMVSVVVPVFLRVTVWALLVVPTVCDENVKEVGDRLATGPLPVPLRLMVCVAGLALSVMVIVPVSVPVVVGVKVTLMEQDEEAARLVPQVLV